MLAFGIILGLYGYSLFTLGLFGFLRQDYVLLDTLSFILLALFICNRTVSKFNYKKCVLALKKLDRLSLLFLMLFLSQALVNLIGALGPELSFDALWYHLTLPKIYTINHVISYIPGNLLYYSAMPQLTEMYYAAALLFHTEIAAKVIHFSFGILICIAIYFFAREIKINRQGALLAVMLFYANLVVGWESITAFSDLSRTFFEFLSLWGFIKWSEKMNVHLLIISAILLGFAISTKLLALGSLGIFLLLIILIEYKKCRSRFVVHSARDILIFLAVTSLTAFPWLFYAYHTTGNPVYPFFSELHVVHFTNSIFNLPELLKETWKLFVTGDDPILPIYLIVIPFIFFQKKSNFLIKTIFIYSILSVLSWCLLPKIGGGRFILPYLPVYSVLVAYLLINLKKSWVRSFLFSVVVLLAFTSVLYRGAANIKYVRVLTGVESKGHFLTQHLNYAFGDFYDTDGYFKRNITKEDTVLLYGFHNLYYVDFPYVHSSWLKKGDIYNYIAVQGGELPQGHEKAMLVYENPITNVRLYKLKNFVRHE